jgi:hypothetical protein
MISYSPPDEKYFKPYSFFFYFITWGNSGKYIILLFVEEFVMTYYITT